MFTTFSILCFSFVSQGKAEYVLYFPTMSQGKAKYVLCFPVLSQGKDKYVLCFPVVSQGKAKYILCFYCPVPREENLLYFIFFVCICVCSYYLYLVKLLPLYVLPGNYLSCIFWPCPTFRGKKCGPPASLFVILLG